MDKKDTKSTKPKTHHRPVTRKRVFDVMPPGRAAANPTSRPVVTGHKPQVKDSVLKQDVVAPAPAPVSVPKPDVMPPKPAAVAPLSPAASSQVPSTSPAISSHRQSPIRPSTAPVLGSLRTTRHPQLQTLKPAPSKDPNARSQLATAPAPTIVPHSPNQPMQSIGGSPTPIPTPMTAPELGRTSDVTNASKIQHRDEDMEGLERLAIDQVIEVPDPDVQAALDEIYTKDESPEGTSILEEPDLAQPAQPAQPELKLSASELADKPDQPPVARPEPLLFEPHYKKKERRGHTVQIIVIVVLVLLLSALVLNFLLDAESITLPFNVPHTDII